MQFQDNMSEQLSKTLQCPSIQYPNPKSRAPNAVVHWSTYHVLQPTLSMKESSNIKVYAWEQGTIE